MNLDRLDYLLRTVYPHVEKMETVDGYQNGGAGIRAIFNLSVYQGDSRATGEPITDAYNCGMEGCVAGWYVMLAERDGVIDAEDSEALSGWDLAELAFHFGIEHHQAAALFESRGRGAETHDDYYIEYSDSDSRTRTGAALASRKSYLEEMIGA